MQRKQNKTKEQIKDDIRAIEKTKRQIILAKLLFPHMGDLGCIYDAQTALSAFSGYLQAEMEKKLRELKVADLKIDLSDEPESAIKNTMVKFLGQLEPENAQDVVDLLESYARILGTYGQNQFLKNPMSIIKVEDLIKDE